LWEKIQYRWNFGFFSRLKIRCGMKLPEEKNTSICRVLKPEQEKIHDKEKALSNLNQSCAFNKHT